jgi:hypothetical protein
MAYAEIATLGAVDEGVIADHGRVLRLRAKERERRFKKNGLWLGDNSMRRRARASQNSCEKRPSFRNERVNATRTRCIGICSRQFGTGADRINRCAEFAVVEARVASNQNDFRIPLSHVQPQSAPVVLKSTNALATRPARLAIP